MGGNQIPFSGKRVHVTSPIYNLDTQERMPIGSLPDMQEKEALEAASAAAAAWDKGQGTWPQMSLSGRIRAIESFVDALREKRTQMVNLLMWEIGKTSSDAAKEFDRTMDFIAQRER